MATRLDRLFVLLESGSSGATRQAAAKQLGEVVRIHPHELSVLLTRLLKCIRSSSWETRVAAGHAVNAIAKNVPLSPHPPSTPTENGDVKFDVKTAGENHLLMTAASFDATSVLGNNVLLMASEGTEYNFDSSAVSGDKQQSMIRKKLGLDFAEKIGMDTSDIVSSHDLSSNEVVKQETAAVQITVKQEDGTQATIDVIIPAIKKRKLSNGEEAKFEENCVPSPSNQKPSLMPKLTGAEETSEEVTCDPKQWPFAHFMKILCRSLFSARWEARHGSATALREVIRVHGQGVHFTYMMKEEWFEDVALRLVCVLMLDRFGDFVSDQVVAPVREAAAQALGWVVKYLEEPRVTALVDILVNLTSKTEWQVRHGALLGMKYIIAVREDLLQTLVPRLYDRVFQCLGDSIDDVAAAAAAALVPAADTVISVLPERVEELLAGLWDNLLNLDELTAATSNVMTLLSRLLAQPHTDEEKKEASAKLKDLVPRLWHFLGHNSTSVRKSTLEALQVLVENQTTKGEGAEWLHGILPILMGQIFYRALVETAVELHGKIFEVWETIILHVEPSVLVAIASPAITGWLALLMSQQHMHLDLSLLGHGCKIVGRESPICLGGCDSTWSEADKEEQCTRARLLGIKMLGFLSGPMTVTLPNIDYGGTSPVEMFAQLLKNPLDARSAYGRIVVSLALAEWAERWPRTAFPDFLATCMSEGLEQVLYYDEIAHAFTRLQQDAKDFMASVHHSFPHVPPFSNSTVLTLNQVHELGETWAPQVFLTKKIPHNRTIVLEDQRKAILNSAEKTSRDQKKLTLMCNACMAEALVAIGKLPEKLSPTVRSLMDSIKMQRNELLRGRAAKAIAKLLKLCIDRTPQPNPKIVKNLITYATTDALVTPKASEPSESLPRATPSRAANGNAAVDDKLVCSKTNGIFGLYKERVLSEDRASFRRQESQKSEPGTPLTPTANGPSLFPDAQREAEVVLRVGGEAALVSIASTIGGTLQKDVPSLWDAAFSIPTKEDSSGDDEKAQALVNCLRTAEIIVPHLSRDLLPTLKDFVSRVLEHLEHEYTAVRHMASRVVASLASACPATFVGPSLPQLLLLLEKSDIDVARQGALEAVSCLLDKTGLTIVPYVPIFIVPVLKRMSDTCVPVRLLAAKCFANLVRLMPLASTKTDDLKLEPDLEATRREQMNFLTQLLNPTLTGDIPVPEKINAKLRRYQQDGFNWLMFLNRYQLHGILCDDMGLGKTLQTICLIVASYEELAKKEQTALPSIVICPPTLTGHWFYEVDKFVCDKALNPLLYAGPPGERGRLRLKVPSHNLIIASYDIVRNDVDFFSSIKWNYCILDEGHVIKNGKTKMAKAIKQLTASHRLILSGTPIQNNVLELWSLFDFLMPGFLGSEREFSWRYSRPILQSRDGKATPAEQQSGALALEALHRQMLPFLLRRMKTDVLDDLPPKITQDYYCELSPLQQRLYEDFSKSQTCKELGTTLQTDGEEAAPVAEDSKKRRPNAVHVFQALQYLKKVCNHPKLVMGEHHPEWASIRDYLDARNSRLDDINHSAKLPALKQLLTDCGIGVNNSGASEIESVVSQHRALVFCQLKSMLDIIETDLFKKIMPDVTYLRLDGSVPASQRHDIVQRFNADASIDVLLLTTQVGGLGLNLTGADTVIFVEHDWNPMKDVQAMDRAHRIGQKKVVNVYRLITRGTLEEKIMGLQKFKLHTANSVINQENSALSTMSTDQLLDAFTFTEGRRSSRSVTTNEKGGQEDGAKAGPKSVLEALPDLWEESQYDEFSLDAFISTLKDGESS